MTEDTMERHEQTGDWADAVLQSYFRRRDSQIETTAERAEPGSDSSHLSLGTTLFLLEGRLGRVDRESALDHLSGCRQCRDVLGRAARAARRSVEILRAVAAAPAPIAERIMTWVRQTADGLAAPGPRGYRSGAPTMAYAAGEMPPAAPRQYTSDDGSKWQIVEEQGGRKSLSSEDGSIRMVVEAIGGRTVLTVEMRLGGTSPPVPASGAVVFVPTAEQPDDPVEGEGLYVPLLPEGEAWASGAVRLPGDRPVAIIGPPEIRRPEWESPASVRAIQAAVEATVTGRGAWAEWMRMLPEDVSMKLKDEGAGGSTEG